jgi:DNA (cytosine-5)-methyltransferase 1
VKFISLFSGIGGFDLGFERAGMECVAQVEIDDAARAVLEKHYPDVPKFKDVKEFGYGQFARGTIDLICGGFPCQDLSIVGKRAGLAGERSGLWFEFARIIDELEPRWVVIENVPGLLSSNGGADFAVILQWLVKRGYGVCWRVLDAQYFGVPQRRRRVFVVASLGIGSCAQVLFESEIGEGCYRAGGEKRKSVAEVVRGSAARDCPVAFNVYQRTIGKVHSPLTSEAKGRNEVGVIVPSGVRRLTPTECARLQGFPDDWNAWLSDTQRYKQFGNAVTVPCAEWIGRRIMLAVAELTARSEKG